MNPDPALQEQASAQKRSQDEHRQMTKRRQTVTEFRKSQHAERRQQALRSR